MLEILAPAGTIECAQAAIDNGADAIYLGLSAFSARQGAGNFDELSFRAIVQKARLFGVKIYVALNTIIKTEEIDSFLQSLLFAWNNGADAIIMQDVFLGKLVHDQYPEIVLHLSTQAGVCTLDGAKLAKEYGFSRVILARETPISAIEEIAQYIETEVFVQGALCTCFSGQCYFSSFAGGNSGNRGRCKQPCRKQYAYDRNGILEKNYALSLSDLCVGEDIEKLRQAGVVSFKIEGRMRRSEYVAAAVRYYRALLDNTKNKELALSDLKRTYNRGNFTKGLAFGQDKRLLSTAVQGHIGEKVGIVTVKNGKFAVESLFKPQPGDAFKILRDGKEIGGATYEKREGKSFILRSKIRLKNGDGVFVTTDTEVAKRVLSSQRKRELFLTLRFCEGEYAEVTDGETTVYTENKLQTAQTMPLTEEELKSCFLKMDGQPFSVSFKEIELKGNVFMPKSLLNGLRRRFYTQIFDRMTQNTNTQYVYSPILHKGLQGKNDKTAVIASDFANVQVDVAVYKAEDYRAPLPKNFIDGNFEKYVYYPAFLTAAEENAICEWLKKGGIDGIYSENYAGIIFAKRNGCKLFAGTGFNLLNSTSIEILLQEECVAYYALSKEGNTEQLQELCTEKGFALASGGIKLMDLCYCPFGKTCKKCDKKDSYILTDENGRRFPVRRYVAANGDCRFEVYNCADLIGTGIKKAGKLLDLTLVKEKKEAISVFMEEAEQKKLYQNYTSGHYKRGVL